MTMAPFDARSNGPVVRGTHCLNCDYRWFPPNAFGCERCGAFGERLEVVEFRGRGRLVSFAFVPDGEAGFVLASIALDDGPVVRGILVPSDDGEPRIGDRVEAYLDEAEAIRFRTIADGGTNQ